jgi:hypothetical protein
MPEGWTPPPPLPGRSTVSIHFADEDDGLPLWAGGLAAPWLEARLSAELTARREPDLVVAAHVPAPPGSRQRQRENGAWVLVVPDEYWLSEPDTRRILGRACLRLANAVQGGRIMQVENAALERGLEPKRSRGNVFRVRDRSRSSANSAASPCSTASTRAHNTGS